MNKNSSRTFFPQYYRTRKENAVYQLFSQNKMLIASLVANSSIIITIAFSFFGNITFINTVISILLSSFSTIVVLISMAMYSFAQNEKLLTEDMKEKAKIADDKIKYRRKINKQQKAHNRKSISLI